MIYQLRLGIIQHCFMITFMTIYLTAPKIFRDRLCFLCVIYENL